MASSSGYLDPSANSVQMIDASPSYVSMGRPTSEIQAARLLAMGSAMGSEPAFRRGNNMTRPHPSQAPPPMSPHNFLRNGLRASIAAPPLAHQRPTFHQPITSKDGWVRTQ